MPKPFGAIRWDQIWSSFQSGLPVFVTERRLWIRLGVLLLLAVSLVLAARLKFDSSLEIWFLEDDPNIVNYRRFQELFGRDEILIIGLESDSLFSAATLGQLANCTQQLQDLPLVRRALSITNVDTLAEVDHHLLLQRLLPASAIESESPSELKRRIGANPLVSRMLLSEDARATAIILVFEPQCADAEQHIAVARQVRQITASLSSCGQTYIAGIPIVNDAMFRYARRDLLQLSPMVFLMVWGTSWFLFRSLWLSVLPLVVVGIATSLVFGVAGWLEWRANFLISALTMALMVVGVSNSIHIISAWLDEQASGKSSAAATWEAVTRMLPPCFMTSFSTCVGFLSLTITDIQPIRQFGILAALGTAFAFLLSVAFLPGLLYRLKAPHPRFFEQCQSNSVSRALEFLGSMSRRANLVVVMITLLVLVPTVWGITLVQTTANPLSYFRQHDQIRRDTESVDRLFGGSCSIEFLVETENSGLSRREVLQQIDDFQTWVENHLAVSQIMSIVDYLKEADRVREHRTVGRLPSSRIYLLLLRIKRIAPEILSSWLDETFSHGRISARLSLSQADRLAVQVPLLESEMKKRFQQTDLRVQTTGYVKLVNNMRTYLLNSQMKSLSLAAAGVTLMMCCLLRSLPLGLLSMIPNLIPVLMGIAVMGFAGIRLDPGTVMIGSVALGLVVDDTCHFLSHYRRERRRGSSTQQAVRWSISHTGRPIVLTSVILVIGFLALAAGSFAPTMYFGVVTSAIVCMALLADLFLMPAILLLLGDRAP